ncbi:hypothetical protein [Actinomadura opuntiae]|uniref:hypothetical protein n=1 Tax=Actinomadura sp. OS1-43 TaxID=604315 RepID=UPI00255AA8E7|nr:hypothetical protein [Actinomadura sp. OS1-43]MDL4813184.1 hypothetical protein [Actinomadura sp. OS1-43]
MGSITRDVAEHRSSEMYGTDDSPAFMWPLPQFDRQASINKNLLDFAPRYVMHVEDVRHSEQVFLGLKSSSPAEHPDEPVWDGDDQSSDQAVLEAGGIADDQGQGEETEGQ